MNWWLGHRDTRLFVNVVVALCSQVKRYVTKGPYYQGGDELRDKQRDKQGAEQRRAARRAARHATRNQTSSRTTIFVFFPLFF
jgi:hypothetical protein